MKRFLAAILAVVLLSVCLSGCSVVGQILDIIKSTGGSGSNAVEGYEETDGVVDFKTTSDGRTYDGHQLAFIGTEMSTAWFDFTIDKVSVKDSFYDRTAEDGNTLLLATITITCTYDGGIPMYYNDFWVSWGFEDSNDTYGTEQAMFVDGEDMGQEVFMELDETVVFEYLFEIDKNAEYPYIIEFNEIYSDSSKGNVFYVVFDKVN